jgi:GNAT superfamily N-acetyltransferase
MSLNIDIVGPERLVDYARVPIAFEVSRRLSVDLIDDGIGGIGLREEEVSPSYVKDYDASAEGGPDRWNERFDIRNFVVLLALQNGIPVGGATLVHSTESLHVLAGRMDMAALWDIRVRPEYRRDGIGTTLFRFASDWARDKGFKTLKIETQNINVPACRFYLKQGCRLGEINRYAYAADPSAAHEVMLVWYLELSPAGELR